MPRCGIRIDRRAPPDEVVRQTAVVVEHTEPTRQPVAADVDVGAAVEQQIDHLTIPAMDRGQQARRPEIAAGHRPMERGRAEQGAWAKPTDTYRSEAIGSRRKTEDAC